MPGVDGFAFLDELRSYPHAPVVVVSSATTIGSPAAEEALARGADACFDKSKIVSEAKNFIRVLKKASVKKTRRSYGKNPGVPGKAAHNSVITWGR